jgi:hypothetical protein
MLSITNIKITAKTTKIVAKAIAVIINGRNDNEGKEVGA